MPAIVSGGLVGDARQVRCSRSSRPADGGRPRWRWHGSAMTTATELFEATFGAGPDGVWSAPGRVNLIGEHTDYNAGLCLPIALPQRTTAAVSRRADRLLRVTS